MGKLRHIEAFLFGLTTNLHRSFGDLLVDYLSPLAFLCNYGLVFCKKKYISVRMWDPIVNKTDKNLAGWKAKYISLEGMLILIKIHFQTLLFYFVLFVMSAPVVETIEAIIRFLWSWSGDDMVQWSAVTEWWGYLGQHSR